MKASQSIRRQGAGRLLTGAGLLVAFAAAGCSPPPAIDMVDRPARYPVQGAPTSANPNGVSSDPFNDVPPPPVQ